MLDIANTWEGDGLREQYRQSALNFRLPYWDYYRPRAYNQKGFTFPGIIKNGLTAYPYDFAAPLVFTTEELMIRQPKTNEAVPTRNPLFNYTFPKVIPDADWNEKDLNKIVGNVCHLDLRSEPFANDLRLGRAISSRCHEAISLAQVF